MPVEERRRYQWKEWPTLFVRAVERAFYLLGVAICHRPWTCIISCLGITVLAAGLLFGIGIHKESSPFRLWVPQQSRFAMDTHWLANRFGVVLRPQHLLVAAPGGDVLQTDLLARLAQFHNQVINITSPSYEDVCFKVPLITSVSAITRKRRNIDTDLSSFDDDFFDNDDLDNQTAKPFDPSVDIDPSFYCHILSKFPRACLSNSLLDLWRFDSTLIKNSTREDLIKAIDKTVISPNTGHPVNYKNSLGGMSEDLDGSLSSAEAVLMTWFVFVNFTETHNATDAGNDAGTEEWASKAALEWENNFLRILNNLSLEEFNATAFYEAGRSFGDLSGEVMFRDADKLVIGIMLMFIYIQLILSKFNWIEVKFMLGSVGLLCVGMALIVSFSICSLFKVPYGPVHNSLPFLLMGLGIDDMFVMKACWDHLTPRERRLPMPKQIGLMLQHAGVSIVVTSFTDIIAFLVGAITILPSLESFCIYAAVGVFFIFIFSVTFYVAIFVLDLKRMESKRNGVLFCIKHPNYVISKSGKSVSEFIMHELYLRFILTKPIKFVIIAFSIIMSGFSLVALLRLEQRFDPVWFIPENSYYSKFLGMRNTYYPEMGHEGSIFIGALNYTEELPKIYNLMNKLSNETDIIHSLDSWTIAFKSYVSINFNKNVEIDRLTEDEWKRYLSKFLFSPSGSRYMVNFKFDKQLECGELIPAVSVSRIEFRFKIFSDPKIYLPAKRRLFEIIDGANFTTGDKFATVWAKIFANWETDEVIHKEVERNLELALACVMFCTLLLIVNVQMCFWIFMCVLLTLVNVGGWMQRWGLTIDIVSCVGLELGIGFCVDYAAHIGHTFLTIQGSRDERALDTVTSIGAAVLYGGGSTLLSLSILSVSDTYIFKTFFKIFFLVITFGLFNGLFLLPAVLSLIGPNAYPKKQDNTDKDNEGEEMEVIHLSQVYNAQ